MPKIIAIAFALTFANLSSAKAQPSCTTRFDSALCLVPVATTGWKVADVLCCCKTLMGGECCTRVAACGGKPPGCFCASPSVPDAQLWSLARNR